MNKPCLTILLLGGARRVSLAELLKRSGQRLGYEIKIVSYDLSDEVPVALEGKVIKGLKFNDPEVIADLERIVAEYEVNIILPIVNGSIGVASVLKSKLTGVFVPVTDFEVAEPLFDKANAAKVFKEAKLPIPRTYSILSAQMPAIVKPRKGGSSRGIHIFNNMEDLMHLKDIKSYIIQEFIEDRKEYTVDCYVDAAGRILVTVPRERLEIMGGESTRSRTCRNQELEQLSHEVIRKFSLRGPVNIQFLHDLKTDRYLLMEVNPRLGGGVICSIYAGAPITDYIIGEALGVQLNPCDDWAAGTLMARYFKEVVFFDRHEQSDD